MFTKIEDIFWKDEKIRPASDDAKLIMLYLLTSPHRNILGLYFLPLHYIVGDLNWDIERVSEGLHELFLMGLVIYDKTSAVILIKNFLKYNPLENENQVKSAIKKLDEVPKCCLLKEFETVLKRLGRPLYKPIIERLGKQVEVKVEVEVLEDDEEETRARVGEVFHFFNENICLITPFQAETISQAIEMDGLEPKLILEVLKDSLGKSDKWSWIKRVLTNAAKDGTKTFEQYKFKKSEKAKIKSRDAPDKNQKNTSFADLVKGIQENDHTGNSSYNDDS